MSQRHYYLWLFSLLPALFGSHPIHAQSPVYEPFNVDSGAVPRGGYAMLETFLTANVQKPFMAQVANVKGRVFVSAIVEPNGHLSDLKVIRGLRPDCDREAIRAMRLFTAWQPALKDGKPVRQTITHPVTFRANQPVRYESGNLIEQFDGKFQSVADSKLARYQQNTPIDTLTSLPNGDLVLYEIVESGKLKEVEKIPLLRLENDRKANDKPTYKLGHKSKTSDWYGTIYTLRADGSVALKMPSDVYKGQTTAYDGRGMVTSIRQPEEPATTTKWQSTGIIHTMEVGVKKGEKDFSFNQQLRSAWDSTGRQLVKDGNGRFTSSSRRQSRSDTNRQTAFVEEGNYLDGVKDGQWTGHYTDGSYGYSEQYKLGEALGGIATLPNGKTIRYKDAGNPPEFVGGQAEMYRYLGTTIRYPADAQRKSVTGKVFISFTVCTDGSLCDYEVLKGVYPSMDAEAIRTVKKMPNWKPGMQRGEPVRVKYNLPISFQLE